MSLNARIDPRVLSRALLGPRRGPNGTGRRRAASGGPSRRTRAYRAARAAAKTPPDGQAAEAGTRAQARRGEGLAGVAVDGKSSRGARRRDGTRVHLLGVVEHGSGHLIDHLEVDTKSNETTAFQPLLSGLDLHGVVVTFDALLSVRANLEWLVNIKGGHYLAVIKKNQPKLHDQLVNLPWAEVPVGDRTRDKGHGRQETRTLKVATLSGALALDFPGAVQAIRI